MKNAFTRVLFSDFSANSSETLANFIEGYTEDCRSVGSFLNVTLKIVVLYKIILKIETKFENLMKRQSCGYLLTELFHSFK